MSSMSTLASSVARNLRKIIKADSGPRPYQLFDIRLQRRERLSPSLCRLVFAGDDVRQMRTLAADQRVKLLFPDAQGREAALPKDGDWQAARRQAQHPMRTYTIRALRADAGELDIDFVLHGDSGPASAWAEQAQPGARLQIVAPSRHAEGDPGGYEWQPPQGLQQLLLIGDETALPAIAGILESLAELAAPPATQVFIEVPEAGDCIDLRHAPGTELHWLARSELACAHGEAMRHAAFELARLPPPTQTANAPLKALDIDKEILWELAAPASNAFYAWVAGESAAVMAIRKHWINERHLDRRSLTLMGYWRHGRSLE
ncbi:MULTISPECIES: siderophore-interacting protein [unclassified Pseudomonas]|uniref:siderophore-interacting protein n=1 Tax=unclassified Pseudomonas TaxID=196821 RepID=UPI0020981DCC|nr:MULTISPECIES: siderophore-interacting protein [unclassified Pseudomonas]MCO7519053.1 siderophore-interacting protein [Pseudomonas sp. 1]MCO7539922.1 siderophore-interacting protein [Pseudomonas sp. VA159-2]